MCQRYTRAPCIRVMGHAAAPDVTRLAAKRANQQRRGRCFFCWRSVSSRAFAPPTNFASAAGWVVWRYSSSEGRSTGKADARRSRCKRRCSSEKNSNYPPSACEQPLTFVPPADASSESHRAAPPPLPHPSHSPTPTPSTATLPQPVKPIQH